MKKLNIAIINIHGLIGGRGLEIGRDADNGGQTKYVFELSEKLAESDAVEKVIIFTRLIDDPALDKVYSLPIEKINNKLEIHRISFAGKKYLLKEQLWPHLDTMVTNLLKHLKKQNIFPDWLHSHYADAAYVAAEVSTILNIPFAHTGHSLGRHKQAKLLAAGELAEEIDRKYKFPMRIAAEERALELAEFIITSTEQEISSYEVYDKFEFGKYNAIAPGIDTSKFYPYFSDQSSDQIKEIEAEQRKYWVSESIEKFLVNTHKPPIMALSRPDRRKNLHKLIQIYGLSKELQSMANLIIFAGIRKDINTMPEDEKEVLTDLLLSMDKYDLYGKMAIPKKHDVDNEVAIIYRYCAEKRGVFVNITDHENFGLTVIESSSSGLPVVVTRNGGPSDIIPRIKSGLMVDPDNEKEITKALRSILTDEMNWKKFSDAGTINVQKFYSWENHVRQYLKIVHENLELSGMSGVKKQNVPGINIRRLRKKVKNLIVSDIDGTFIAPDLDNPGLEELKDYLNNRPDDVAFAYASGRNLRLLKEAIETYELPRPDLSICSIGSEIYYTSAEQFVADKGWATYLDSRWARSRILQRLNSLPWLEEQEEEAQKRFKISFYCDEDKFDPDEIARVLGNLAYHVNIIYSHGSFLDILPKRASKGNAIKYISRLWNIRLQDTIAAGDSGNDRDMFRGPVKAVIVSNRSPELSDIKSEKSVYLASRPAAAGIMEGLKHYNIIG